MESQQRQYFILLEMEHKYLFAIYENYLLEMSVWFQILQDIFTYVHSSFPHPEEIYLLMNIIPVFSCEMEIYHIFKIDN